MNFDSLLNLVILLHCVGFVYCMFKELLLPRTKLSGFTPSSNLYQVLGDAPDSNIVSCTFKCYTDKDCDTAVTCTQLSESPRCFLVSGDVIRQNITNSQFATCSAVVMKTCLHGGAYYNKMCHCRTGFTGSSCELVSPGHCHSTEWQFQFASYIGGTSGSKSTLFNSASQGKQIKVIVQENATEAMYMYNIQTIAKSTTSRIRGQTWEFLKISFQNRSDDVYYRSKLEPQTTSHVANWLFKIGTNAVSTSFDVLPIAWYAREYMSDSCLNTTSNTAVSGLFESCRNYFNTGADFLIADAAYTKPAVLTLSDLNKSLSADKHSLVADIFSSGIYQFKLPSYILIYTDNIHLEQPVTDTVFRWKLPQHIKRFGSIPPTSGNWLIDNCWHLVASISNNVNLSTLKYLLAVVENGKPIRVLFNGHLSDVNHMTIVNGTVVKAVINDVFNSTSRSQNIAQMIRTEVSTSSQNTACTFLLESNLNHATWSVNGGSKWFTENREWKTLLQFNSSQQLAFGSIINFTNVSRSGVNLRLVIKLTDSFIQALPVNNVHYINSSFIVMDTGTLTYLQTPSHYCGQMSGYLSTDGVYETVRWTTGTTIIQPRTSYNYITSTVFYQT